MSSSASGIRTRVERSVQFRVNEGVGGEIVRAARVEVTSMGSEKVTVMLDRKGEISVASLIGTIEVTIGGVRSAVVNVDTKADARRLEERSVAKVEIETVYLVGVRLSSSSSGIRMRVEGGSVQVGAKDGVDGVTVTAERVEVVFTGSEKVTVMLARVGGISIELLEGEIDVIKGGERSTVVKVEVKGERSELKERSVADTEIETVYVVGTSFSSSLPGVRMRMVGGSVQVGVKEGVDGVMARAERVEVGSMGSENITVMFGRDGGVAMVPLAGVTEVTIGGVRSAVTKVVTKVDSRKLDDISTVRVESEMMYVVGITLSSSLFGVRVRVVGGSVQVETKKGEDGVMERADRVEEGSTGSENTSVILEREGAIPVVSFAGVTDVIVGGVRSMVVKVNTNADIRGLKDRSVARAETDIV